MVITNRRQINNLRYKTYGIGVHVASFQYISGPDLNFTADNISNHQDNNSHDNIDSFGLSKMLHLVENPLSYGQLMNHCLIYGSRRMRYI